MECSEEQSNASRGTKGSLRCVTSLILTFGIGSLVRSQKTSLADKAAGSFPVEIESMILVRISRIERWCYSGHRLLCAMFISYEQCRCWWPMTLVRIFRGPMLRSLPMLWPSERLQKKKAGIVLWSESPRGLWFEGTAGGILNTVNPVRDGMATRNRSCTTCRRGRPKRSSPEE